MSANATPAQESAGTDRSINTLDARDARALTEYMTVLADVGPARDAPDLYAVVSESGRTYTVDARTGACDCPDATHNAPEGGCKHRRRVAYVTGERAIPGWVDRDAVDAQFGEHVEGGPRVAATDGGEAEAVTEGETEEATEAADSSADSDSDGVRAVAPREYTRGYWVDDRYDDNFRFDPPSPSR
jgi:hypothetical protein